MNTFLVKIGVITGSFEKEVETLVQVNGGINEAIDYALSLEAHNEIVVEGVRYLDGDDFIYEINEVMSVKDGHVAILGEYLTHWRINND